MPVTTSIARPVRYLAVSAALVGSLAFPVTASSAAVEAADVSDAYTVDLSDILSISVWRNPELAVTVPVRPDGRISVPLVGDIEVAGLNPDEIAVRLTKRLEEFVNAPAVSVMVTEINSRKVYVLGEVTAPGAYDLVQPIRLLQLLAMAGGFTEFAKKENVVLVRTDFSGSVHRKLSVKKITSGQSLDENILLRPGDTIFVP